MEISRRCLQCMLLRSVHPQQVLQQSRKCISAGSFMIRYRQNAIGPAPPAVEGTARQHVASDDVRPHVTIRTFHDMSCKTECHWPSASSYHKEQRGGLDIVYSIRSCNATCQHCSESLSRNNAAPVLVVMAFSCSAPRFCQTVGAIHGASRHIWPLASEKH